MLLQIQLPEAYLPVLKHLSDTYGSRTAGIKVLLDAIANRGIPLQPDPDAVRRARESAIASELIRAWGERRWRSLCDPAVPNRQYALQMLADNQAAADSMLRANYRSAQYARRLAVPTIRELIRIQNGLTLAQNMLEALTEIAPDVYTAELNNDPQDYIDTKFPATPSA